MLPGQSTIVSPRILPARIVVAGAMGFVGTRLVERLLAREVRVVAVLRPERDPAALERRGIETRFANLDRDASFAGVFDGADAIVHLSGMAQMHRLVGAIEAAGIRRGVFVGSTGVHTRLVSPGADSKRRGEAALRASSIGYTIVRPTMIYGTPGDRNLARLLRWLARCPVIFTPGGGATLQQPVHVDDLVAAIVSALERPETARREYDLGGPQAVALAELIRASGEALGRSVWSIPLPLAPVHALVAWARKRGLRTPVSPEQVLRLTESKAVDIEPARVDLGFAPRSLIEGLRAEVAALHDPATTAGGMVAEHGIRQKS